MASQPTEKERNLYNKACKKVINILNEEDEYIDKLKRFYNAYRRTKNIEFKSYKKI